MADWREHARRGRVPALLVLMVVTGLSAVSAAPDEGRVIGIWPVGLAAGLLLWSPRRRAPWLLGVVGVVALATISTGRPPGIAVGYSLTIVVETAVVWWLLSGGRSGTWVLRTDADLRRWLAGCLTGGLVAAAGGALTSLATDFGDPGFVALALGTAHVGSLLTLTPLWAELPRHTSIARTGEHVLQWVLIVAAAPAVFALSGTPPLTFLLVPLLAWSALRIGAWESLAQMVAVLAFAIALTTAGLGPFAAVPDAYDLPRDLRGVLLAAYAATCALIVVPLLLRVGESVEVARTARAERDRLDRVVAGASGGAIIGADARGRITLFNPGAERMLGYTSAEVLGRETRMFHSEAAVRAKAAELGVRPEFVVVAARLMEPDMAGVDMLFTRKDGVERTHSMTLSRLRDERGETIGFVSTSEDVTDRVAANEALRDALARMREVDEVKDAFVSSVSHELRTPLTSIHGYLELLAEGDFGELTGPQAGAVQRIASNSQRLLSLIDDLLTLSRIQQEGLNLAPTTFDLREVVREGCAVVDPRQLGRALDLQVVLPEVAIAVEGDREMLERVVINLVGNACKFTPDGGRVEVALEPVAEGARLRVTDTGIGIPVAEQQHLFTRFFRSSLAQQQAIPGTGLGLSITQAVVRQHHGDLRVVSAPGEGTTVLVVLPARSLV